MDTKKIVLMIGIILIIPLLNGCIVSKMEEKIESPKIDYEEKIVVYESEIGNLEQEIINLKESKDYYKNYSNYCYDLIMLQQNEIEEFYNNPRFKYTWRGCKYNNELRLNAVYQGDSMLPLLGENHKITWCIPYGDDDVYVGDIVIFTFTDDSIVGAHQIIKKEWIEGEWVYITQGINNPLSDGAVLTFDNIKGKLWKVEG